MKRHGYTGGGTIGGKWGCAISALVGLPLLGFAFVAAALEQCARDAHCIPDWQLFGGAIAITTVAGFVSRAGINALVKRLKKVR